MKALSAAFLFIALSLSFAHGEVEQVLPQIVAGPFGELDLSTFIQVQNGSDSDCGVTVTYTRGGGQLPAQTLLTDGQALGNTLSLTLSPMASETKTVTSSSGLFIGSAVVEGDCQKRLSVQGGYSFVNPGSGGTTEIVAAQPVVPVRNDECVLFPMDDLRTPGFAFVSVDPLSPGSSLDFSVPGTSLSSSVSLGTGTQQALTFTDLFEQNPLDGTLMACLRGADDNNVLHVMGSDFLVDPFGGVQTRQIVEQRKSEDCAPGENTLCLLDDRFKVQVDWRQTPSGPSIPAGASQATDGNGFFYFFSPDSVDLVVGMMNNCPVDNRFWVFYGALSNVDYTIRVTDTESGSSREYANQFTPVQDTSAFATCP